MTSNSTQQIRPVIECFCQILSSHGFSGITPEIFRLAKFDRDEAVSRLTHPNSPRNFIVLDSSTLAIIIRNSSLSTNESESRRTDREIRTNTQRYTIRSSLISFTFRVLDELVNLIKNDLFTRGYTYEYFLALDDRMLKGSRQLLICLGWLIYHLKLIEMCLEQCLNKDSIFDYDDTSSLHFIDRNQLTNKNSLEDKDLIDQVKQAMRINAKLRFSLRKLHGLVIENANLQHQVSPFLSLVDFHFTIPVVLDS